MSRYNCAVHQLPVAGEAEEYTEHPRLLQNIKGTRIVSYIVQHHNAKCWVTASWRNTNFQLYLVHANSHNYFHEGRTLFQTKQYTNKLLTTPWRYRRQFCGVSENKPLLQWPYNKATIFQFFIYRTNNTARFFHFSSPSVCKKAENALLQGRGKKKKTNLIFNNCFIYSLLTFKPGLALTLEIRRWHIDSFAPAYYYCAMTATDVTGQTDRRLLIPPTLIGNLFD